MKLIRVKCKDESRNVKELDDIFKNFKIGGRTPTRDSSALHIHYEWKFPGIVIHIWVNHDLSNFNKENENTDNIAIRYNQRNVKGYPTNSYPKEVYKNVTDWSINKIKQLLIEWSTQFQERLMKPQLKYN